MFELELSSESKVHWSKSSFKRKLLFIDSLINLPVSHTTVAGRTGVTEVIERQRRKTLKRSIYETNAEASKTLTLESISNLRTSHPPLKTPLVEQVPRSNGAVTLDTKHCVRGHFRRLKWSVLNGQSGFWEKLVKHSQSKLIEI
jgi:hypothetical protein